MAPDAVQLAIGLIDPIRIEAVSCGRHTAWDHTVGEGFQVDTEELRPALDLGFLTVPGAIPGRVG